MSDISTQAYGLEGLRVCVGAESVKRIESYNVPVLKPGVPLIASLYDLALLTDTSPQTLSYFMVNSNRHYKTFYIDKDTKKICFSKLPGREYRELNNPIPALKKVQKILKTAIFDKLPIHSANYAYVVGRSPIDACRQHCGNRSILKLDMKNFFPSHTYRYVLKAIKEVTGYSDQIAKYLALLTLKSGVLPQGAPTSPILSIVLNYKKDDSLATLAESCGLVYTRYADDLHFSGDSLDDPNVRRKFVEGVKTRVCPFKLNEDKEKYMTFSNKPFLVHYKISPYTKVDVDFLNSRNICWDVAEGALIIKPYALLNPDDHSVLSATYKERLSELTVPSQYVPRILGMNILDVPSFSTKQYNKLRVQAMYYAKGTHNNPNAFKGKLSYLKQVDLAKYDKLMVVINKFKKEGKLV